MVDPQQVHEILRRHQLVDGHPFVLDLERSHGAWIVDAVTGTEYLDAFTCFASWPMGYNHPKMVEPRFLETLQRSAVTKVANSDLYTVEMAGFVQAFAERVTPEGFPHHFWVSGGSLAVENGLKAAFDWKARKLGRTDFGHDVNDLVILHFEQAFHGRSGYTLSLTNTVPDKIGLFPKFRWPRVHSPAVRYDLEGRVANDVEAAEQRALAEIDQVYAEHGDRVAAILIEPMQGEGGDNHFRGEFLAALRRVADERESLLMLDEVQTGFFGSGKPWLWQHLGVAPDIVAFGKKTQVCGIYVSPRIDEVPDNVFRRSSRINSTWGGNLVDMVRCRRMIEIIEEDGLAANVADRGAQLVAGLRRQAAESGVFDNVRGVGSLVAFDLPDKAARDAMIKSLMGRGALVLPCGPRSIRFRLPFIISAEEIDELLNRVGDCLPVKA